MATLVRSLVGLAAQEDYQEVMFAEESSVVAPELDEPIRYRSESMLFYCRALTLDEDVALPQLPIYLDPVYF